MIKLHSSLTQVDSSAQYTLRTKTQDTDGNEYIYLKGVASTAVGSWVTYDEAGATTLIAANAIGPVAVAKAAIGADEYGWYQIVGKNTDALAAGAVADNAALYISSTAGKVDDAVVAGDCIVGAVSRASIAAAGALTVQLNYPVVTDKIG